MECDSRLEDAVKVMASGILSNYFTVLNGFIIASEQTRNYNVPDFIIIRIQRRFPGDRGVVDHTIAEAKKAEDRVSVCLEQLENALEQAITEIGRC